jgi:hypothetical protein
MALGLGGGSTYISYMATNSDGSQVSMSGVTVSCPYCGGVGDIQDGVFDMVREGISALRSISNEDAQRLLDSLTEFEKGEASAEDVAHATPEFARAYVAPFLKKNWLALLIAIVSVIHADASNRATIDAIREHDAQISSEILNLRDAIRVMDNDSARSAPGSENEPRKGTGHRSGD